MSDVLSVLEGLAAVVYDVDALAGERIAAAESWFALIHEQHRPGEHHTKPLADPELEAHKQEHAGHVAGILLAKYHSSWRPDERLPSWTSTGPKGWRPSTRA